MIKTANTILSLVAIALLCVMQLVFCGPRTSEPIAARYQVEVIVFEDSNAMSHLEQPAPQDQINSLSAFQPLSEKNFKLIREANRLQKDAHCTILLHKAWVGPLALPSDEGSFDIQTDQVKGNIKVTKDKYVTVQLQLGFMGPENVNLNETRRMHVNELNYFSSPPLSVLVKVIPI